jgi:hypothetical protein
LSIIQFLISANGIAQLFASDNNGTFLGLLSSDRYDQNSLSNPFGAYGGCFGMYSIRNQSSWFGGDNGLYSPYSLNCLNPPTIVYQGQAMLVVTKNLGMSYRLPVVDPDLMLGVYGQMGNQTGLT